MSIRNQIKLKKLINFVKYLKYQFHTNNQKPKTSKNKNLRQKEKMELLAYRSLFIAVSSNQHFIKSMSFLSKVTQIIYPEKSGNSKQKKPKCWICGTIFQHTLMLIMHLEVLHSSVIDKYEVRNQVLTILPKINEKYDNLKSNSGTGVGFGQYFVGMVKNNRNSNRYMSYGTQFCNGYNFVDNQPAFIKKKIDDRCKQLVTNILLKIQKPINKKQQIYFHSTNIFKKINCDGMDEDSEDEIGEVEKQLEKLRIEDFSDVNDNDKKFFVEWNGFIHEKRKTLKIILAHQIPNLFVQFSGLIQKKGIPRINLVMHAWTLWSVGQINSHDLVRGLNEYDQSPQRGQNNEKNGQKIGKKLGELGKNGKNNSEMQIQ